MALDMYALGMFNFTNKMNSRAREPVTRSIQIGFGIMKVRSVASIFILGSLKVKVPFKICLFYSFTV